MRPVSCQKCRNQVNGRLLPRRVVTLYIPEQEESSDCDRQDEDDGEADGDAAQRPAVVPVVGGLRLGTRVVVDDDTGVLVEVLEVKQLKIMYRNRD